jgi:hypothetical protein
MNAICPIANLSFGSMVAPDSELTEHEGSISKPDDRATTFGSGMITAVITEPGR